MKLDHFFFERKARYTFKVECTKIFFDSSLKKLFKEYPYDKSIEAKVLQPNVPYMKLLHYCYKDELQLKERRHKAKSYFEGVITYVRVKGYDSSGRKSFASKAPIVALIHSCFDRSNKAIDYEFDNLTTKMLTYQYHRWNSCFCAMLSINLKDEIKIIEPKNKSKRK